MAEAILELTPEESLLLITCRPYLDPSDDQHIRRLVAGPVDWNLVVWRSELHRITPLVYYHLRRLDQLAALPPEIASYLGCWSELSMLRSKLQLEELARIVAAFNAADVEFCLLKGTIVSAVLLPQPYIRPMLDLDLLVNPGHLALARTVMSQLKYVHAEWNPDTGAMRTVEAAYQNLDEHQHYELPAYMKQVSVASPVPARLIPASWRRKHLKCLVDDSQVAHYALFVDLHVNVSFDCELRDVWHGASRELVAGQPVLVQSYTNTLWFLASRLYHEVFQHQEAKLTMLGDIHTILHRRGDQVDWNHLLGMAAKYSLQPSLYYVLSHVANLTGATIPPEVLRALRPGARRAPHAHDWGDLMPELFGYGSLHRVRFA